MRCSGKRCMAATTTAFRARSKRSRLRISRRPTMDRRNPDYARYMALVTTKGPKRVCWNSWIAPHNFEGFFLNMGDMLVKAGDWQTAQKIYGNAKLTPEYGQWKFRQMLEDRIE